ncbi:hypothetical protein RDABS01_018859 [Bienertia sinuspersici]
MYYFTWINDLWKHLFGGSYKQENTGDASIINLPNDIMSDILSKLLAKSVLACRQVHPQWLYLSSTPYFADLHLMRVTPILLGQERTPFAGKGLSDYKLLLYSFNFCNRKYCYYIYSLSTTFKRKLRSFPYFPLVYFSPYEVGVVASGALFWIVRCITNSGDWSFRRML